MAMLVTQKLALTFVIITSLFLIMTPGKSYEDDTPSIEWVFSGFTPNDGFTNNKGDFGFPNTFTITDPSANNPGKIDTISATIQSVDREGNVRDSIELTLSEEDPFEQGIPNDDSGVFRNKNIIVALGTSQYEIDDTITIVQEDPENFFGAFFEHTSGKIDIIPDFFSVFSSSDTDTFGGGFPLKETGPNSHKYTGTIRFSTVASDFDTGTILVKPGDILWIFPWDGIGMMGLINPNPDPRVGAIHIELDDYVRVIYKGIDCPIDPNNALPPCAAIVSSGSGGGVGSGGPVLASPRIVLDIVAPLLHSIGGGGSIDRFPPSLHFSGSSSTTQDGFGGILASNKQIDYPLIINDKRYNLPEYSNAIDPVQLSTGQEVDLTLQFLESSKVDHVALHFVDVNKDELTDTDPRIIFDKGNVEKSDPDGILGDEITFSTSRDGVRSKFNFGFNYDKPTNRHLMITAWDENRNSENTKVINAFEVSGQPLPNEENHIFLQDLGQYNISEEGIDSIDSQSNTELQVPIVGYTFPDSVGRIDRHDMKLLNDAIDYEKTRAIDILDNNFNLNEKSVAMNDETKQEQNIERAPQLSWSNVGHKMRDFTNTPQENSEMIKSACWQEHLKAEKVLKSLLVGSKYQHRLIQ